MRVLVTGGTGFVGRHVVRLLAGAGEDVTVLTRDRRLVPRTAVALSGDLLEPETYERELEATRPEAAIHLGWYVEAGRYQDAPINFDYQRASLALLERLASAGCARVVMVGTCLEYAPSAESLGEDSPTAAPNAYARAKLSTSIEARAEAEALGISFAWARLFYLYGPGQGDAWLVPALIRTLVEGGVFRASAATQERDYLHVEDAARGLCVLARSREVGVFNVCSGQSPPLLELMDVVRREVGATGQIDFGARPAPPDAAARVRGDATRLRALGWRPEWTLEDGVSALVRGV